MDDIIKKTIKELVLNFISEMNEWEKFCNNLKNENTQLSWNEKHDTYPAPQLEHDTEVDNAIPELTPVLELNDEEEKTAKIQTLIPEDHDTEIDHDIPKQEATVTKTSSGMTFLMLVFAALGGLCSWIFQSCQ